MAPPTPSTTFYCQVSDISDFLRIPIDRNSSPNDVQVANIINRKEDEIDRRTGHAWRSVTISNEIHALPLIYTYGWGTPIFLQHRSLKDLDTTLGDIIEVWDGQKYTSVGALAGNFGNNYNFEPRYGRLFLRGYLYSILRDYRVRVTYRYGETTPPGDIKDVCIKMACIDLLTTSFKMDKLGVGTEYGLEFEKVIDVWRNDIERTIWDRTEVQIASM